MCRSRRNRSISRSTARNFARARRHEGGCLLRSNIEGDDPGHLWRLYLQRVEIEPAFKERKNDLSVRPIHHQLETRIEANIFVAFLAYCLMVTLKQRLQALAPRTSEVAPYFWTAGLDGGKSAPNLERSGA